MSVRLQKIAHNIREDMKLCHLLSVMTSKEKHETALIIKNAELSRLLKNTPIRRELKAARSATTGKIKRFLSQLSKHADLEAGIDVLFNKWSKELV